MDLVRLECAGRYFQVMNRRLAVQQHLTKLSSVICRDIRLSDFKGGKLRYTKVAEEDGRGVECGCSESREHGKFHWMR
jgi:hypothetical protein